MPMVTATPRGTLNGEVVTEFTDVTSTTSVTYTYPVQQAGVMIENSGVSDIYVTVGSYTNQVINPDKKWRADASFTSFSIRSNVNSQEFIATAFQNDVEGSGEADLVARAMARETVGIDRVNFIRKSTNLLNLKKVTVGYAILSTDGTATVNSTYTISEFIPVSPASPYSYFGFQRVAYYNEAKEFISMVNTSPSPFVSLVTPANARFIRVHYQHAQIYNRQINQGSSLLAYEENYTLLSPDIDIDVQSLKAGSVSSDKLSNVTAKGVLLAIPENCIFDFTQKTLNIKNCRIMVSNKSFLTGNVTLDLSVFPDSAVNAYVLYYDPPSSSLGAKIQSDVASIPQTAIIFGAFINVGKLIYGIDNYTLDAVKYSNGIPEFLVPSESSWKTEHTYVIDGTIDGTFTCPVLENKTDGTAKPLYTYKSADFYAEYDNLMSQYPQYITKSFVGNEVTGLPIYRYDFKAAPVEQQVVPTKTAKAILVSGSHPENLGTWCLFQTMKQICDRWKQEELLETLRWNVHFIVVPVWGPWQTDNDSRKNSNGVNVGRNFPPEWILMDPADASYGGPSPLSELESQYLHQILLDNRDALFHVDFHNFFATADNTFIWVPSPAHFAINVGKSLVNKMSRKWKKEYPIVPQDETTKLGYGSIVGGSTNLTFAETLGMRGTTFEALQAFPYEAGTPRHSSLAITLATEAFVNFLLYMLKSTVEEKNAKSR